MEAVSVTYDIVKNKTCIVCGLPFSLARAGKLYCSSKCKQFAHYHKAEIMNLEITKRGVPENIVELSLQDFEEYCILAKENFEFTSLKRKSNSGYASLNKTDQARLEILEESIPEYAKFLKVRNLSLEGWSFLKSLYPYLIEADFLKVLDGLDYRFFENFRPIEDQEKVGKLNPVRQLFIKHLEKLAEGKINFIENIPKEIKAS